MPALNPGESSSPSNPKLDVWTQIAGVNADVAYLQFQIWDRHTDPLNANPAILYPSNDENTWQDVDVSGADHLAPGRYVAQYTVASGTAQGDYEIRWRFATTTSYPTFFYWSEVFQVIEVISESDTVSTTDAASYVVGHVLDQKNDTVSVADATAIIHGNNISVNDSVSATDADTLNQGHFFSKDDTTSTTDVTTVNLAFSRNESEVLTITDGTTQNRDFFVNETDTTTAADTDQTAATYERDFADTVSTSDATTVGRALFRNETDTVTADDAATELKVEIQTSDDTVNAVDGFTVRADLSHFETVIITDAAIYEKDQFLDQRDDTVTVDDAFTVELVHNIFVSDTVDAADSNAEVPFHGPIDTVLAIDAVIREMDIRRIYADAVTAVDHAYSNFKYFNDTGQALDAYWTNFKFKNDTVFTTDDFFTNYIRRHDTVSTSETTTKNYFWRYDTVSIAEAFQRRVTYVRNFADTVSAVDAIGPVIPVFVVTPNEQVTTSDFAHLVVTTERVFAEIVTAIDNARYNEGEFENPFADTVTTSDGVSVVVGHVLVFADHVEADDATAPESEPFAFLFKPPNKSKGVRPDTQIGLEIHDGLSFLVDFDTVQVFVEDVRIWNQGAPQAGWAADVDVFPGFTRYIFWAPDDFAYKEVVSVRVTFVYGSNLAHMVVENVFVADVISHVP